MKKTIIPFAQVPQLAKTDVAYAIGDPKLSPFYTHPPALDSLDALLEERKQIPFPRKDLTDLLEQQYALLPVKANVQANIQALRHDTTFTVTTAHQPSLFLGPLYFIYKALTTINLAEALESRTGDGRRIIPVFVLGSEDHDLEELNKVNILEKKSSGSRNQRALLAVWIAPVLSRL
ncbi:MAG: bacillithiol biosynthesis BshC [Lewinellaceae bacterium]|nr:bacillithiol biosynthesis BshC [Lewinellaceae bacterium]